MQSANRPPNKDQARPDIHKFIGIFNFGDVLRRRKNALAVDDRSHLIQSQRVLLDGKRAVNRAYSVFATSACQKTVVVGKPADQLGYFSDILYYGVCNLERRLGHFITSGSWWIYYSITL